MKYLYSAYRILSHLSNDGVEETPPPHPSRLGVSSSKQSLDPWKLFANLEGCNVGFKHFHPMPITQNGAKLSGQAQMGGVWEWTSSVLEKHDGFEPMDLYPAYTGKQLILVKFSALATDSAQPTSSTTSTTSSLEVLGLLIPALPGGRHCMLIHYHIV